MARRKVVDLDCDSTVAFEKKGQQVEGYYLGFKNIETDYGPSKLHVFKGEDGNFGVYGSHKLDEKLASVPAGAMTFVTFDGKVKIPGGKTMKRFDVDYDDELIDEDAKGASLNFQASSEPEEDEEASEETAEETEEDANDVDEETLETADEEETEEEAEPAAKITKKPLTKGAPVTVSAEKKAKAERLLSQVKR